MKIKLQPQIGAAYEELTIDKPVTVRELADRYQPELPYRVLLANVVLPEDDGPAIRMILRFSFVIRSAISATFFS